MATEKDAERFVVDAREEAEPAEATVALLFAIEARLKMLTIVARDTVRPIGTFTKGEEDDHATD